jgi:DNA-binding NarL/FixJ family response regulator
MGKISILIAEDHQLIRESCTCILNDYPYFEVIAGCSDSEQAVEMAKQKRPDIVLMDISITPFNGFVATEKIRLVSPLSKIIGLSVHSMPAFAKKMFKCGAKGYMTKNSSIEEMHKAIIEVYNSNKYLCEEIKSVLSEEFSDDNISTINLGKLTYKEMQISQYASQGLRSKEYFTKNS